MHWLLLFYNLVDDVTIPNDYTNWWCSNTFTLEVSQYFHITTDCFGMNESLIHASRRSFYLEKKFNYLKRNTWWSSNVIKTTFWSPLCHNQLVPHTCGCEGTYPFLSFLSDYGLYNPYFVISWDYIDYIQLVLKKCETLNINTHKVSRRQTSHKPVRTEGDNFGLH